MATISKGSVGLTAVAFSASLPCIALTSQLRLIGCTSIGTVIELSHATSAMAGVAGVNPRSIRRFIVASRGARPKPSYLYVGLDFADKGCRDVKRWLLGCAGSLACRARGVPGGLGIRRYPVLLRTHRLVGSADDR
jgi:hypothetical protein